MERWEIVRRAIYYEGPPRLPVRFASLGQDDTALLWPVVGGEFRLCDERGFDEWGCRWEKTHLANMGQVKGHPLKDLADLDQIQRPDYDDDRRYEHFPRLLDQYKAEGRYVLVGIFMVLFERMHSLYGFKETLLGLVAEPEGMAKLADLIVDVHLKLVRNIKERFGSRVHGFHMSDDWGTQKSAFISFELWEEFFLPRYRRLFQAMRAGGYDVWVHSCGKINEIIEGYIRAGANVVNLQQPRALGIPEIGRRYRGRIAFETLADIQQTLPKGDPVQIRRDAEEIMAHWADRRGGVVFSDYGDDEAIGVKDPRVKFEMYQAFSELSEKLYGEPLPEPTRAPPAGFIQRL